MKFNQREFIENECNVSKSYVLHYQNEKTGTVVYIRKNELGTIGFKGKSTKKAFNYTFKTHSSMMSHIDRFISEDKRIQEEKEKRSAEKKAFIPEVIIGDIFATSWGFDQTNVEFYQVINVNKRKVTVQELKQKMEYFGEMSLTGKTYPLPNEFLSDENYTRIVQVGNRIKINEVASGNLIKPIQIDPKGHATYKGHYFSQTG